MASKKWPRTTLQYFYHKAKTPIFNMTPQTHKQKVLELYKECLKNIRMLEGNDLLQERYLHMQIRKRFEENRNIKDYRLAKKLLEEGKQELHDNRAPPINFNWSPGGVAYNRMGDSFDDSLLDSWHPLEKSQYPYYFARREQRKLEYLKLYESEYGNPEEALGIDHKNDYVSIMDEYIEQVRQSDKEYDQMRLEAEKQRGFIPDVAKLNKPQIE